MDISPEYVGLDGAAAATLDCMFPAHSRTMGSTAKSADYDVHAVRMPWNLYTMLAMNPSTHPLTHMYINQFSSRLTTKFAAHRSGSPTPLQPSPPRPPQIASELLAKLISAAYDGRLLDVEDLLSEGADVNGQTIVLQPGTDCGCFSQYPSTSNSISQHSASAPVHGDYVTRDRRTCRKGSRIDWCDLGSVTLQEDGRSPLMSAVGEGHLDVVWLLLRSGADTEVRDSVCVSPA
eukprot:358084-Chlamydomonas_euryale.AAC.3